MENTTNPHHAPIVRFTKEEWQERLNKLAREFDFPSYLAFVEEYKGGNLIDGDIGVDSLLFYWSTYKAIFDLGPPPDQKNSVDAKKVLF